MKTINDVISAFPENVTQKYDFSAAEYRGGAERMVGVLCPDHGEFSQYPARFRKGFGCPTCGCAARGQSRAMSQEQFIADCAALHGGRYSYTKTRYARMTDTVVVTCPIHGDFSLKALKHYYSKHGCGACATEARKIRIPQHQHLTAAAKVQNTARGFFDRCSQAHGGKYHYPDQPYLGAKYKIRVVCPTHGEFEQAAWAHLNGRGCAVCGAYNPKWEEDLAAYLQSLGFTVERNVPLFGRQHADLYVRDRALAIELHGLHWHTERTRDKLYHRRKWESAQQQGIRLLQIFEDEWRDSRAIIEARIAAVLGISETWHARKGEVVVLSPQEGAAFLAQTHLQGAGRARVFYGLKISGDLKAVASFGTSRSGAMVGAQDEGTWEVIRYASIGRVRGGFSRLFARFVKDFSPAGVVSYCDLRYGDGALYKACGFSLESVTEPDYWWVPHGKVQRIPRYQTQKHKLPTHPVLGRHYDPTKSEVEICHAAGWSRLYGVGHQRWLWKPLDPTKAP